MKTRLVSLLAALSVVLSAVLFAPSLVLTGNAAVTAIALSAPNGFVGDTVTVTGTIDGTGFAVRWDSATGTTLASGTSVSGAVSVDVVIPDAVGGAHNIFLVQTTPTPATNLSAAFTVDPNIVLLDPADATELTLLPNGIVGTQVKAKGTGYATAETVAVDFDGTALPPNITLTAASKGTWRKTITVPARPASAYLVTGTGLSTGPLPAAFSVDPSIVITPTTGAVNTLVTVTGNGFQPAETVTVDYGPLIPVPFLTPPGLVPANGRWVGTFRVPSLADAPAGSNDVVASGTLTPATVDTTKVFSTPNITLTPPNGPIGSVVTVDGVGFQPNETGIHITWNGVVQTTTPATVTADAAGAWTATFVTPVAAVAATPTVDASGATTSLAQVPDQTFTVDAGIAVNPTTATVGTTVTVTGTGFGANELNISLQFNGGLVRTGIRANAIGNWTTTFVVPATSASPANTVDAAGSITPSAILATTPNLTISPVSGPSGTTVTASGTGFQAGDAITVTLDTSVVTTIPASPVADASGSWTATFVIPALSTSGAHTVDASGTGTLAADVPDQTFNVIGLAIDKTTGPVGTVVTASGTGFRASETGIQILWDGASVKTGITADTAGAWTSTFTVPAAVGGSHLVDASGSLTSASIVPAQSFFVTAKVDTSATTATPGDTLTVTGSGFAASESGITVTFDGTNVLSAGPAGTTGSWSASLSVPNSARGVHQVNAYGVTTTLGSAASVPLSVQQGLSISPSSGTVGATVTVSGGGFYASETGIQVLFNGAVVKSAILANAAGTWSTTFVVPSMAHGNYTVDAMGLTTTITDVPEKTFTVNAKASLDPASGFAGKVVTITGSGFAASSTITVAFEGSAVVTTPSPMVATSTGNISGTFIVPSSSPGSHTVAINDGTGPFNASFNITSSVSSSVTSGAVGAQTSFAGQGFPANTPVTFTFDSAPLATPSPVTTSATGAFTVPLNIPEAARGTHTIKATSGATTLTLSFEVTPSATPSVNTGTADSSITVTGKGFGASQALTVTVDGKAATTNPAQPVASATGGFSVSVVLPRLAGGSHIIKVADSAANVQFNVSITPKVVVATSTAKVGDKLTTSGTGMPAGAAISVSIDGAAASTNPSPVVAGADGTFSAEVTAPAGAFGPHTIRFSAGGQTSEGTYSIAPAVSGSADNGNVGTSITINGTGFAANSQISATFDSAAIGTTPTPAITNAQGGFQLAVAIPKSLRGQHALAVSDAAGHKLELAFNMESTAPAAPALLTPVSASRLGTFGGATPTFTWATVSDPSGVTYTLQVSKDAKFSTILLEKTGLTTATYTLAAKEKLGSGFYYWRVKAIDGASNEGGFSQVLSLKVGILPAWMPLWLFILLIVVGVAIILGIVYLLVFSKRSNGIAA